MASLPAQPDKPRTLETRVNADRTADLWLYGTITDERMSESDITALDVVVALNQLKDVDSLIVHLNSNGGDVFEGLSIYNTLQTSRMAVNIIGEGIVASIASVIAMAGDHFAMAENSKLMIHNPLALMLGAFNKHDMAKMSAELDVIRDTIVSVYTGKTGMTSAEVIDLLDGKDGAGTFFSPQEALVMGFCDSIVSARSAGKRMVAMLQPSTFRCRGHTVRIDLGEHVARATAPKTGAIMGGENMASARKLWAPKARKQAAKRGRIRAEIVGIECPHCGLMLDFDTEAGIVSPMPEEGATVAVPLETQAEAKRRGGKFRNELFKIACPVCGGDFDYETEPDAGEVIVDEPTAGYAPDEPIVQAKRGYKARRGAAAVKAVRKRSTRMEGEVFLPEETEGPAEVPITCTECGEAFAIDVDPTMEEAVITCPACGAELIVDTSGRAGNEGAAPDADEEIIVAYRKGVANERRRQALLDERTKAFPQYANAIEGFKKNGTSAECAGNWIFQALAANPGRSTGNPAYRTAARRDAQVLNKVGSPVRGDDRDGRIAAAFDSLAKRRGTKKDG